MDQSPTRLAADGAVIGVSTVGALMHWLPPIAALVGLIWGCICIGDWATGGAFGRWVRRKVMGNETR